MRMGNIGILFKEMRGLHSVVGSKGVKIWKG